MRNVCGSARPSFIPSMVVIHNPLEVKVEKEAPFQRIQPRKRADNISSCSYLLRLLYFVVSFLFIYTVLLILEPRIPLLLCRLLPPERPHVRQEMMMPKKATMPLMIAVSMLPMPLMMAMMTEPMVRKMASNCYMFS